MPIHEKARNPRAPTLPKRIPTAGLSAAHAWAAHMLNDDIDLQAIDRLNKKNHGQATTIALCAAHGHIYDERNKSAANCLKQGGILYAFHGSKAFAMPAQVAA